MKYPNVDPSCGPFITSEPTACEREGKSNTSRGLGVLDNGATVAVALRIRGVALSN